MPPSSIGAHILQLCDISPYFPLQFVLYPHGRELGVEVENLVRAQLTQFAGRMDEEPGHDALAYLGPDAIEELKGFLVALVSWEKVEVEMLRGLGKSGGKERIR